MRVRVSVRVRIRIVVILFNLVERVVYVDGAELVVSCPPYSSGMFSAAM